MTTDYTTNITEADLQGWTPEQADEDSALVAENTGDRATYWKCPTGQSVVRMLPAVGEGNRAMVVTYQHYLELPGRKVVFACPAKMVKPGLPCPACKKAMLLKASKNPADLEAAKALRPRLRIYSAILDRAHPEVGPQVWGYGSTVYEQLRALRNDQDVGDFFRVGDDGFDIIVNRKGTTKNDTEYHVRPSTRCAPLGDLTILEALPDLAWQKTVLSYEDIIAKIKGDKSGPAQLPGGVPTAGGVRAPIPAHVAAPPIDPALGF